MRLTYPVILEKLENQDFISIPPVDETTSFLGVRLLTVEKPTPDYLHIRVDTDMKEPGFYVDTPEKAVKLLCAVQDVFDNYNTWMDKFKSAILQGCCLQDILNIAVEVLINPIAIIDSSYATILYAGEITGIITDSVWYSVINNGYFRVEEYSRELKETLQRNRNVRTVMMYDPGYENQEMHVTAPLISVGKNFASIGSCDINGLFTKGQVALLSAIQEMLEYAFEKNSEYQILSDEDTYYVDRLIQGYSFEDESLTYYLRKKMWKAEDSYQILSIQNEMSEPFPESAQRQILLRLKLLLPDSIVSNLNQHIILVLHNPTVSLDRNEKALIDYLHSQELLCGISTCITCFKNLEYAYIQSQIALQRIVISKSKPVASNRIQYFLSDYQNLIMESLYSVANIKAFCHPLLLEYWQEKGADAEVMLSTIEVFLTCGCSITQTAENLNIHRNTLQYRLDRILHKFGIDLKGLNTDERFYLLFSCHIISYLTAKQKIRDGKK